MTIRGADHLNEVFTQEDYNFCCKNLDRLINLMKDKGKTEEEAQAWLKDFINTHYCNVWRAISFVEPI